MVFQHQAVYQQTPPSIGKTIREHTKQTSEGICFRKKDSLFQRQGKRTDWKSTFDPFFVIFKSCQPFLVQSQGSDLSFMIKHI